MNTVLYIGDSYVTSLSQLCHILSSRLSPEKPIYDEVLTSFMDGTLEKWLEEGDGNCKAIANKVRHINNEQSNSIIMEQLVASFPDMKNILGKPDIFKYLSLEKAAYIVNSKKYNLENHEPINLESKFKSKVSFEFTFLINRIDNESFDLELSDIKNKVIKTTTINLGDVSIVEHKKIIIVFSVNFAKVQKYNLWLKSYFREIYEIPIYISKSDIKNHERVIFESEIIKFGKVKFKMIHVKGGTFKMGATSEQENDAFSDEYPVHEVTLSDFSIGEMQVTQELWKAVMRTNPSEFKGDKLPVENVSWNDCQEFIRKLNAKTKRNFRLPTEAEWEYAARGGPKGKGYKYAGSNSIDDVAWYDGNSGGRTHEVGLKSPNELGLYDMSGNVWEWCNDWFGGYSSDCQTNPTGPSSGMYCVGRGGGWIVSERTCRVSNRNRDSPVIHHNILGLRLAL